MRGFLTIEILIALVVATLAIGAVSITIFVMPGVLGNANLKLKVLERAWTILNTVENATHDPLLIFEVNEDESVYKAFVSIDWIDIFSTPKNLSLERLVQSTSTPQSTCDPFTSGDWTHPSLIQSYSLTKTSLLAGTGYAGDFYPSDIQVTPTNLVVSVGSTTSTTSPTLFIFSTKDTETPKLVAAFDNASTSKIGFSSLSVNGEYLYAGNGFGSASSITCSDKISCASVQVFSLPKNGVPYRVSSVSLSTTSLPYAVTQSGANTPVTSVTYYRGFLYVGLQKTLRGSEFSVLDARDPSHLSWSSGYPIGRTVNGISVRGNTAYVSTDDPSKELQIFDVSKLTSILLIGVWNAPGSTSFGYGVASTVYKDRIRFGRTYISNATEFTLLDSSNPLPIKEIQGVDSGTVKDPESVKDILTQDRLTFVLLTRRLDIFDTHESSIVKLIGSYTLPIGSIGVALACRNNLIYTTYANSSGAGFIDILRGT